MTVGKAIYNLLLSNADLRAIVDTRIFPEVAQQDAVLPYVVYNVSSNEPSDTKREPSKLDTAQIEVNLYSTSYTECIDMATHTRAALDRVTGTYSGVNVQSIQYLGEIIDFDEAQRTYNITADYDVRISRTDFEIAQGSPITGVTLGELSDVDVTGVTDGQLIAYDAAAQEWQPADDAGGVTQLGQLTDVQFGQGGPETGELLKYDGSEWTNDSLVKSEVGLGNVDNTSDADKPVSTATQTALSAKANSADFSNVDNTSDADKPVSTATQTALNAKADTSAVPTDLNDLSDVTIVGTPAGNQALIYDATAGAFKSQVSYTNRFEDEVETGKQGITGTERAYSVKGEGDGVFLDAESDTPAAGKIIKRKIYHKTGFITDADVIGDYTLIHTFADNTAYSDTVATFDGFEDGATYGVPPFTLLQTWEEVSATAYLLDETFGSGAEAAYSTRQLRFAQNDCMVIRRASDSTTTTIGFDGSGNISEADIISFCTGTTCTLYQWLDQSGNGNTATAPSGQEPTIYTGGALVKENGRVAFTSSKTTTLSLSTRITNVQSAFLTLSPTDINVTPKTDWGYFLLGDTTTSDYHSDYNDNWLHPTYSSTSVRNGSNYLNGSSANLTTTARTEQQYLVSLISTSATNTVGTISKDRTFTNRSWVGSRQEIILYSDDRTNNRTDIEENVGDYFTQNTPLLDTYSGAAAAYSLRLLDSSYVGSAVEVYNGSSYADIGFNVFGELDTVALAAHCGSNDGFVSKWYCQSGNSNDAVQTTTANMPKIYDGTTGVVTENGKPAVDFVDSAEKSLKTAQNFTNSDTLTLYGVIEMQSAAWQAIAGLSTASNVRNEFKVGSSRQYNIIGTGSQLDGPLIALSQQTLTYGQLTSSGGELAINGNTATTGTGTTVQGVTNSAFAIGSRAHVGGESWTGTISEVIMYFGTPPNRTGIESNLNTFYDIF